MVPGTIPYPGDREEQRINPSPITSETMLYILVGYGTRESYTHLFQYYVN